MDTGEKKKLIYRNCVEVIEESELDAVLSKKTPVAYCGYEVSGEVHLGHMVTTTKLLDLLEAGFHVKVLFADWHTFLNRKGTWDEIGKLVVMWKKAFAALGLSKAEFVLGSDVQRNAKYIDDVMQIAVQTTIKRSLRSMQEVGRDIEHAHVSQVIYPFMQIVDMKALSADVASSGIEQRKIHMLAREVLGGLNFRAPVMVHTPLIPSLKGPGEKMSSSKPETMISVRDDDIKIRKKISKAYCPEKVTEDNPVLSIAKLIVFPRVMELEIRRPEKFGGDVSYHSYEMLEKEFLSGNLHPADLKAAVAEELCGIIGPIREKIA